MTRPAGWLLPLAALVATACGSAPVQLAAPEGEASRASATEPSPPADTRAGASADTKAPPPVASEAPPMELAPPGTPLPKEIGARHILVQFLGAERAPASVVRTREQAEALAQKVLVRARRGESFTRLVTEYSDEPGAAGRGGALGRFGRGRMVPAFEEVAFRMRVGQLSDVVETPFGFHVILRTE